MISIIGLFAMLYVGWWLLADSCSGGDEPDPPCPQCGAQGGHFMSCPRL